MENNDLEIIKMTIDKSIEELPKGTDFIISSLQDASAAEMIMFFITPYNMQIVFDTCRAIRKLKKHKKEELDYYVTFSRFVRGADKIFCDWLSISNGIIELFCSTILEACGNKEKITNLDVPGKYIELIKKFNEVETKYFTHVLTTDETLEPFLKKLNKIELSESEKSKIISDIKYIVMFQDILSQFEGRWCPFRHNKKLKFTRDYYQYNSHAFQDVQMAQENLKTDGRVTAKNKFSISTHNLAHKNGVTIFDDFMEHITKILT